MYYIAVFYEIKIDFVSEPSPQEKDVAVEFNNNLNIRNKTESDLSTRLKNGSNTTAAELAATILWGPCDTTVMRGARVVLETSYAGNPEPRVQWLRAVIIANNII